MSSTTTMTIEDLPPNVEGLPPDQAKLARLRHYLQVQLAGHATHVPIAEVRRIMGWTLIPLKAKKR